MKTLKQNKDLKSTTACFATDSSSGGILFYLNKTKPRLLHTVKITDITYLPLHCHYHRI